VVEHIPDVGGRRHSDPGCRDRRPTPSRRSSATQPPSTAAAPSSRRTA